MKRRIAALTAISIALMLSNVGIQALIAVNLGASAERDALFVAMSVPLFLNALAVGSFSVTITPAILLARQLATQRRALVTVAIGTAASALLLTAIFYSSRGIIVGWLAPGFAEPQRETTALLLGISAWAIPFQTAAAVMQGYWVARERVYLPGLCSLLGNLVIAALMLGGDWRDASHIALACALGAALTAILLCATYATETLPSPAETEPDVANSLLVRTFYAQAAPLLIVGIIGRSNSFIERHLASGLPDGTLSCLGYAGYLLSFLVTATVAPASTAFYGRLCQHWNKREFEPIQKYLRQGLHHVLLASLGLAGAAILFFGDVLTLVQPWTSFTLAHVHELTTYVQILMVGFLGLACASFVARIFYVAGRFVHASLLDCVGFVIYAGVATLGARFGGAGLAIATGIYAIAMGAIFIFATRRQFGISLSGGFWRDLLRDASIWGLALLGALAIKRLVPGSLAGNALALLIYCAWLFLAYRLQQAPARRMQP